MFSVVIKNSILMLLLILILHFMIINYISDLQIEYGSKQKQIDDETKNEVSTSLPIDDSLIMTANANDATMQDATKTVPFTALTSENEMVNKDDVSVCKNDEKELYDFVYGDTTAEGDLNSLYDQITPCVVEKNEIVECTSSEQRGDTISFCKNDVDQHFENKHLERLQQNTQSQEVTKDGNPVVFTYNESQKELLDGFESFGSSYMLLKN